MEKTNFWKDVAKYGAIIGALLAVSFMLETRLQISASFGLYAIEWIAVVVLHYYLLHRFTRRYSMMYTAEEGFSFGQGAIPLPALFHRLRQLYGAYHSRIIRFYRAERRGAGQHGIHAVADVRPNTEYPRTFFFKNPVGRNFREYSVRCRFRPYHCRRVVACAQTVRYPAKRIGTYRE